MTRLTPPVTGHLAVDALVVVALAVGAFLYIERPAVGRGTVLASLPWVAVGVALHALRGLVAYPEPLLPLLDLPWAYLLAATLAGLAWLVLTSMVDRASRAIYPHYFAAIGIGVLLPPTTVLVVRGGGQAPALLVVWFAVPLVAVLATYVMLIGFGLWMPESGYFAGLAGGALIFGLTVDGVGTALALGVGERAASPAVVLAANAALHGWTADPLVAAWLTVWLRLGGAVAVVGALTALNRWRPAAAERGLELATVAAALVAANTFLGALGSGFA